MRLLVACTAIFSIASLEGLSAPAVARHNASGVHAAAATANAHVRIIDPGDIQACGRLESAIPAAGLATGPYRATVRCDDTGRSAGFLVESPGARAGGVRSAARGRIVSVTTVFE